jgi:hypothetical protein
MSTDNQKRQRLLLIIVGIGVGVLVLDSIVIEPLLKMWQTHAAEITKLKQDVIRGRGVVTNGERTERRWREIRSSALPADPAQAEQMVISSFDKWGQANNIELGSIKPQWKKGTKEYSTLECRVDATGSLSSLTRFMFELEKSPLALRVDSVELTARDDGGNRITLGLIVSGLRMTPLEGRL